MSNNDSSALVGHTIAGKFVINAVIAVGGAGTVYRARQLGLDRMVALKLLREEFARDEDFIERFKREARAASRLEHPNSVRVLDFGQHGDSTLYLAMEYVEGRTLFDVIREDSPLSDERIVDILSQVLAAVGVAHDMGVVHRDLKPENIMIIRGTSDEGEHAELVKVLDFGIASLGAVARGAPGAEAEGPRMTKRGLLVGTPEYMAPEQAGGERADRRSDLYSLGVVLYHMLAGRLPFDGDSALTVAVKHITEAPPLPSQFGPVNAKLEVVCLRALSKAPDERFASAREMRAALRGAINLAPGRSSAPQTLILERPSASYVGVISGDVGRRRTPLVVGIALATLLVAGIGARWLFQASRQAPAATLDMKPAPTAAPGSPAPPGSPSPPIATASGETPTPAGRTDDARETGAMARRSKPPAAREVWERTKRSTRSASATVRPTARGTTPSAVGAEKPTAGPTERPVGASELHAAPPGPPATKGASPPPSAIRAPADLSRATVSFVSVASTSAIPGANIRAALSRAPMVHCYREALRAAGSAAGGTAVLRLKIDVAGYVTAATLEGAQFLPEVKSCVERAVRSTRIKDVDTGEATADITLNFACAP
jgi:serine/threonine-protein kinase